MLQLHDHERVQNTQEKISSITKSICKLAWNSLANCAKLGIRKGAKQARTNTNHPSTKISGKKNKIMNILKLFATNWNNLRNNRERKIYRKAFWDGYECGKEQVKKEIREFSQLNREQRETYKQVCKTYKIDSMFLQRPRINSFCR